MNKGHLSNRKEIIFVALLASFTCFVYPPCELYLTNVNEFWFTFRTILPIILVMSITCICIMAFIGYVLPSRIYNGFTTAVFAFTVAFYVQGNYLNNNYGVLDGKEIIWKNYAIRGYISIITWILVILIVVILMRKLKEYKSKVLIYLSLVLVAMQSVGLAFLIYNKPAKDVQLYDASSEGLMNYSSDRNIIVLLLDAADSTVFTEILENNPEISNIFKDFTYYDNTSGMYPSTKASIPYILTGIPYENQEPYRDYIDRAYDETELFNLLKKNKYQYGIYTNETFLHDDTMKDSVNGVFNMPTVTSYPELGLLLFQASWFKFVPQQIKQWFWVYSDDFNLTKGSIEGELFSGSNLDFLEALSNKGLSVDDKRDFKFIHLHGVHAPYDMDENMNALSGGTLEQQYIGVCNMVNLFFEELKEKGVYNNSCIIVLADHGVQSKYCHCPLFMIKEAGKTGDFLSTDSTAFSYAGIQDLLSEWVEGSNLVNIDPMPERRFLYYEWNDKWSADYMPTMKEYEILGNVNDTAQIIATGRFFSSEIPKLKLDKKYVFYDEKTANDLFIQGLGWIGSEYTWSDGAEGILRCETTERDNIYACLEWASSVSGEQFLEIRMDDQVLYSNDAIQGKGKAYFMIPKELIQAADGTVEIHFQYVRDSNTVTGDNEHHNIYALRELTFSKEPMSYSQIVYGEELSFKKGSARANTYFLQGLSFAENEHTWTVGKTPVMAFHADETKDIYVKLSCYTISRGPQHLIVSCQDQILYDKEITDRKEIITFKIPKELVNGNVEVKFQIPSAISPKELGWSEDTRTLGLGFESLEFSASPFVE